MPDLYGPNLPSCTFLSLGYISSSYQEIFGDYAMYKKYIPISPQKNAILDRLTKSTIMNFQLYSCCWSGGRLGPHRQKNFILVFTRARAGAIFSCSCWSLLEDHRRSGGGHDLHSRLDLYKLLFNSSGCRFPVEPPLQ